MARLLPDAIFHVGCGRGPRISPRFSWRLAQGPPGVSPFTRGSTVPSCTRGDRTWLCRASPPSNNKLSSRLFTSYLAVSRGPTTRLSGRCRRSCLGETCRRTVAPVDQPEAVLLDIVARSFDQPLTAASLAAPDSRERRVQRDFDFVFQ